MFSYAKSKGMDWGVIGTLPEIVGLALHKDGHLVFGKKHCHTKQIPEEILISTTASVLGLTEFDEAVFKERVQELRVPAFNHLIYVFKDGSTVERVWTDKSRSESWDFSMRQQAAGHAKRRYTQ